MTNTEIFLKKYSVAKNVNLKDMAEYAGISQVYLSYMRNGKKTAKYETWQKIIEFLKLDEKETNEAWEAWNFDRMSPEMIEEVKRLKEENKKLNHMLDAIKFLKQ